MAAAKDRDEQAFDDFLLANDYAGELLAHPRGDSAQLIDGGYIVVSLDEGWRFGRSRLIHHRDMRQDGTRFKACCKQWRKFEFRISYCLSHAWPANAASNTMSHEGNFQT